MRFVNYLFPRTNSCDSLRDEDFISMIQSGGNKRRRARNCLYEVYFDLVNLMLKQHRVLTQEDALDAYGDAVIALDKQVYENKFKKNAKLRTFFQSIYYYKCIDNIRSKPTNFIKAPTEEEQLASDLSESVFSIQPIGTLANDLPSTDFNQEEKIISDETLADLQRHSEEKRELLIQAMRQLNDKCRRLLLDADEGFDSEELAQIHNFQTGSVARTTLYNCRKKLLAILKGLGIAPEQFFS